MTGPRWLYSSTRSGWGLPEPLFDADGPALVQDLDLATEELRLRTRPRKGFDTVQCEVQISSCFSWLDFIFYICISVLFPWANVLKLSMVGLLNISTSDTHGHPTTVCIASGGTSTFKSPLICARPLASCSACTGVSERIKASLSARLLLAGASHHDRLTRQSDVEAVSLDQERAL